MKSSKLFNCVIDRCASTNDLAKSLGLEGLPEGTWISARAQESGRGRSGRTWISEEGNLFLSMIARPSRSDTWTWVPLTAAVAVAGVLVEKFDLPNVSVKWPNDVWVDRRKVGGILCEGIGAQGAKFIVIGIGLNCAHSPQGDHLRQPATSLSEVFSSEITADHVREDIVKNLRESLAKLENEGAEWVSENYRKLAYFRDGDKIIVGEEQDKATVIGLGEYGELLVKDQSGQIKSLFAEEVTRVRTAAD